MEKLLSEQLKDKNNHAGNLTANAQKIVASAMEATQLFFCLRTAKTFLINLIQDDLS